MAKYMSVITCLFMINMITSCVAVDYTVGDWAGWTLGLNYTSWSAGKTFVVGDNLVFKYRRGHTVDQVNIGDYTSCALENIVSNLAKIRSKRNSRSKRNRHRHRHRHWHWHKSRTSVITLETPGTHYFICAEPGYCIAGMKFAINVSAKEEAATPTLTSNNVTAPLALAPLPPFKKSGSQRAGLPNLRPFVASLLLALVLL